MEHKAAHNESEGNPVDIRKEPDVSIALSMFEIKRPMIAPAIIILAYIFLVTFTPNLNALDTGATRFLTLSVINLAAFAYLLANNRILKKLSFSSFFGSYTALFYTGFIILSLLSLTQALNLPEAIVHFAKLFSVFSAVMIIYLIILHDIRYVKLVILIMVLLLLFDSFWVFQQIFQFINGHVARINDITTIYSNKNILSASIFLKLPFALSMLIFDKGWMRYFGWSALFFGILAIFLLASRAFYLGLLALSPVILAFTVINFFRWREKMQLKLGASYLFALLLAFSIHSLVQQNMLPKVERHTQPVQTQLAIISTVIREDTTVVRTEASTWERLDSWRWSYNAIKENPVLGVGAGNWKVNILEQENQENPTFLYMYKAHNDFLEHMAESGIAAGLLYIAIFISAGWTFLINYRKQTGKFGLLFRVLFLAVYGLGAFAVDAFFNFPADRPVISLYWILFLPMCLAATVLQKRSINLDAIPGITSINNIPGDSFSTPKPPSQQKLLPAGMHWLFYILIAFTAGVLFMNYQSSVIQRIVVEDINAGNLDYEMDLNIGPLSTWSVSFENPRATPSRARVFPELPGISLWGESFHALQARYLIKEGRFKEAIKLLKTDMANPWDSRREYLLSKAYKMINQPDSAFYYAQTALELKPNHAPYIQLVKQLNDKVIENSASAEQSMITSE